MMMQLVYRLTYLVSRPNWDTGTTPPAMVETLAGGDIPPGACLDLGCGTGTNTIYMAQQGREAIGIDFVPEAIRKARARAQQSAKAGSARFIAADVTRLDRLNLPKMAFALDMGCFHGLNRTDQQRYIEALSGQMLPGGVFMLYALAPRREAGIAFGLSADGIRERFAGVFQIERVEEDDFWGRDAIWCWMRAPRTRAAPASDGSRQ